MKHFIVSIVVFLTLTISLIAVRGQDCDPSSGCSEQSYCVASGFCSCLSGFSGVNCSIQPPSSCSSSFIEPGTTFNYSLEFSLILNQLNVRIYAPLEKNRFNDSSAKPLVETYHDSPYSLGTTISWAGTSECEYPSSLYWTKEPVIAGSCFDSYSLSMDSDEALSSCGFIYDSTSNSWSNDVTLTRFYWLPPNGVIMDPSRRVEHRPMIGTESRTSKITLPARDSSNPQTTVTNTNEPESSSSDGKDPITDEDAAIAPQSSPITSTEANNTQNLLKDWKIIIAAVVSTAGVIFIVTLITVVIVRKRRSRRAQAQFNFEGINSN